MHDTIDEILTRGVEEIIDRKSFEAQLRLTGKAKKKLVIKLGIDPTSKNIHIGRAVALWKLRDLQELGHKVVFIVGDFTGLIGDTSDKDAERPMLTQKQVKENLKDYIKQVGKILDLKKTEIRYNSEWLSKLKFLEIAEIANEFTLHEFAARENIAKRMKEEKRISLRELLYPLMQGYDSVAIKASLEVGGTDQRFNLLAGRTLQRKYGQEAQNIMTFTILEGTDGRKMSSSWGNVINITDTPKEMFGKTMSILDSLIIKYFILCTRLPMTEIQTMEKDMQSEKLNPRDAKAALAKELVRIYHGIKAAENAETEFVNTFKNKEVPTDIEEFKLSGKTLLEILNQAGLVKSNGEAKRLVMQGGVKIDGEVIDDITIVVKKDSVIQIGKKRFIKIV